MKKRIFTSEQFSKIDKLLILPAGSTRYGLVTDSSDKDLVIVSTNDSGIYHDVSRNIHYFIWNLSSQFYHWGDPLLLGNLTGSGAFGPSQIINYLNTHRFEIPYTNPIQTLRIGLSQIAQIETTGFPATFKYALRTAIILNNISRRIADPFTLSPEEREIYFEFREHIQQKSTRMYYYKKYLSPEVIHKLTMMPTRLELRDEYFSLLKELGYCDRVFSSIDKRS